MMIQCFSIIYCGYLGGYSNSGSEGGDAKTGRLLTIEEVGQILNGELITAPNGSRLGSCELS